MRLAEQEFLPLTGRRATLPCSLGLLPLVPRILLYQISVSNLGERGLSLGSFAKKEEESYLWGRPWEPERWGWGGERKGLKRDSTTSP